MVLSFSDWAIMASYFLLSLGIGLYYRKRAGKSTDEFFLGGRSMPWYLAGLSMVATTFAADTPLAVTELVANNGVSGNWLWWNMLAGGMLTTFFFARLWRRAGILTELELIELRYTGKPAAFLRGFKAVWLGIVMNVLIIAWVNVALNAILSVFFGIPEDQVLLYTAAAMLVTAGYSAISGIWGVAVTDAVQFVIAMSGCIILAILVLDAPEVGGMQGLLEKIPEGALSFFPSLSAGGLSGNLVISVGAFLAFIGVQWWASWYPGAEPGGGGYVAQRMMSAKSEKDSLLATLFFQMAHYCLRPWPWIIVGLATLILYPELQDKKLGYVMAMKDYLPPGLRGLLLVAFFAAYMSTIATQLNWGASYLVNDLYARFMKPENHFADREKAQKHYVLAGKWFTMLLMACGLMVTPMIKSISAVWEIIIECGAGLGLVLILRWYWWRINAWSELTATLVPFLVYSSCKFILEPYLKAEHADFFAVYQSQKLSFFITVGITTLSWLVVTFLTPPEPDAHLRAFYEKVKPGGRWTPYQNPAAGGGLAPLFACWLSAIIGTYGLLFATGSFLFQRYSQALGWGVLSALSLGLMVFLMNRTMSFEQQEGKK
jgi:SSS family solute:Na+ symporter